MNGVLGHLCAHMGKTWPGETPVNGEMNEMTLLSRHGIRNSGPGGLRPSKLPLGHGDSSQYSICTSERRRNISFEGQSGVRTGDFRLSKQAAMPLHQGPRPTVNTRYQYIKQ